MSLNHVFDIAGSALVAETTRLTASASNMSNANVVTSKPEDSYKAQYPVFKTIQEEAQQWMDNDVKAGVAVTDIYESQAEAIKQYEPNNPLADADGFVYAPDINYVAEVANIISASKAYQMNLEVLNTSKHLIERTLQLGE
ncbi:flagellar basal body rod protein FlgC [Legionella jordanis]|uniref:Flagellar basal-body rod protein FlgC n=1 Tax=Legionella jordanis TaxID=456 RepID=A0A0W0V811_9GAMM|nr:flagellar basal body rod protein FlgC [Legionella jordanis]KTD16274.1 flagellar basal body rod protein FlgC [Legionella jordanis]RMX04512.1 flagellar basal body rod protein FlgC [Legionella jordanis]RMX21059.1 flagellar basal body rod protein FlgC [Legionella jordanis]VEH12269.1 flagellar basal-body rod protein FlgC [Legionella jordanis]HAT8713479.1 flagellar basal body rod protein FlgC [Legionella jordanis]